MSIKVMNRVWEHSPQVGGNLLVLLALADFSDDDGWCWPATETLAAKARITDRHARRVTAELKAAGEIEIHHGKGRNGTNLYRVLPTEVGEDTQVRGTNCPGDAGVPQTVNKELPTAIAVGRRDSDSPSTPLMAVGRSEPEGPNARTHAPAREGAWTPVYRRLAEDLGGEQGESGEPWLLATGKVGADFGQLAGALGRLSDEWDPWRTEEGQVESALLTWEALWGSLQTGSWSVTEQRMVPATDWITQPKTATARAKRMAGELKRWLDDIDRPKPRARLARVAVHSLRVSGLARAALKAAGEAWSDEGYAAHFDRIAAEIGARYARRHP